MKIISIILLISALFYACGNKKDLLPNAGGKAGEVIVVIEKNVWNSSVGEALKSKLMDDYPALPQDESTFSLYPVPLANFSDIFQLNRNIIKISFNPNSDSALIRIGRDRWAKPQLIIELVAKDIPTMSKLINLNADKIKEIILNEERLRLKQVYTKFREKSLIAPIQKKYGIDLIIPTGYRLNLDTNNFMWISSETPYMSQGLFIYDFPYTDTAIFNTTKLLALRDSILKKYIPGPLAGTYMTTEHNYTPTEKRFYLNNNFYYEIRGLWKIENDFMGGPFINLSTVIKNKKLVIIEGYVYAPKDDKKTYIWQMEAILYSISQI
ncbi:MAG: DUF4837 family protein [Bacteroidales bacterium]|nr:DUF4837 family protein [Bacteroidales bacterium]